MRLTKFSDYALRVLLYAASRPQELVTIEETARVFGISRAHLKKVVLLLSQAGYVHAVRGRRGGFTLGMPPAGINLGALLRLTEGDLGLVECFREDNECRLTPVCRLPRIVNEALEAFVATFDRYTLEDILLAPEDFMTTDGAGTGRRGPDIPPAPREAA